MVVLSADLALIDALVGRSNVLYDKTPLVHSLVEVDANARVWCKRIETDSQRMNLFITLPSHLDNTLN